MVKIIKEGVLIEPTDLKATSGKFEVLGVLNPGAARLPDGKIFMYVRVIEKLKKTEDDKYFYVPRMVGKKKFEVVIDKFKRKDVAGNGELDIVFPDGTKRLNFISHFRRVVLDKNGMRILSMDKKPSFYGIGSDGELGVEDPRITKIGNRYVMTYVSLSRDYNISTALATSDDGLNWTRQGIIFNEQDKDVVIFPERVNGKYVAFDRPEGNFEFSQPHVWIAYSSDLKAWGGLKPMPCLHYDHGACTRTGAGPPPIKTAKGWLLLYHAVTEFKETESENEVVERVRDIFKGKKDVQKELKALRHEVVRNIAIYAVGGALFDLENPEKMLKKSPGFVIVPEKKYEHGTFEHKKVVFPTAAVPTLDGKDLLLYCGAGDVRTTYKKVSIAGILKELRPVKK